MPATITQTLIYSGLLGERVVTNTFSSRCMFLYMIAPDITAQYEVDAFLQVRLNLTEYRLVRLENFNIINTEATTRFPVEFKFSNLDYSLLLLSSDNTVSVEIYAVETQDQLDDVKDQLNRVETQTLLCAGASVASTIIDYLTGGLFDGIVDEVGKVLLPPNSSRKKFVITNPIGATEPVFVKFQQTYNPGDPIDKSSYFSILNPGQQYVDDIGWQGNVLAYTQSGSVANVQLQEFI